MPFGDENAGKTRSQSNKNKGEKRKKGTSNEQQPQSNNVLWKKKSIFFRLPYWKDNLLWHNLNVMHIKKNMMGNILGMILDMKGKTKDNLEARRDLQEMGLRRTLHPYMSENGTIYMPATCYTMFKEDKTRFLKVLQDVSVTPEKFIRITWNCLV